jgi:hypothetical protein
MNINIWKKKVDCAFSLKLPVGTENSGILEVKNYTIRNPVFVSELRKYLSKM